MSESCESKLLTLFFTSNYQTHTIFKQLEANDRNDVVSAPHGPSVQAEEFETRATRIPQGVLYQVLFLHSIEIIPPANGPL